MKKVLRVFLVVLVIAIVLSATIMIVKKKGKQNSSHNDSALVSNNDYVYTPDEKDVVVDKEKKAIYFNNLIKVYLSENVSEEQRKELAESVDGSLVSNVAGFINSIDIKIKACNLDEINKKAGQLMKENVVQFATYSVPLSLEESSKTDRVLWNGEEDLGNEDKPEGADWWAEAIHAYSAWELEKSLQPIIVGITDNGFDIEHEDLKKDGKPVLTVLGENSIDEAKANHGTQISGLIAAQDNSFGLRGLAAKSDFACIDISALEGENLLLSSTDIEHYLNQLAAYAKEKKKPIVINASWGKTIWIPSSEGKQQIENIEEIEESIKNSSYSSALLVDQLMDSLGDGFILVEAAGNGYRDSMAVSADLPSKGYDTKYAGFFCGITQEIIQSQKSSGMKHTYDEIKSHIMIVASVKNEKSENGAYKLSSFSNYGETIDFAAPGENIYSTFVKNKYGFGDGTSFSAPIVSGAVAFIWSLDQSLSAADVKQNLLDTAGEAVGVTGEDAGRQYPMLNLGGAAKLVAEGKNNTGENNTSRSLKNSDIVQAINQAATFAFSWFWDNQYYDQSQSVMKGEMEFCPIVKNGISTESDVKALTQRYFTEEATKKMMQYRYWMEKDNRLYTSANEGLGGVVVSNWKIQIKKQSDTQYEIKVNEYYAPENNKLEFLDTFTMHYKWNNENWVFDKEFSYPKNIDIEVVEPDLALKKELTSGFWVLDGADCMLQFKEDGSIYDLNGYGKGREFGCYVLNGTTLTVSDETDTFVYSYISVDDLPASIVDTYREVSASDKLFYDNSSSPRTLFRLIYRYKVEEETDQEIETTQEEKQPDVGSNWQEFLQSGKYKSYLKEGNTSTLKYAEYDLNQDGSPELLMEADDGASFYYTWLFTMKNNKPSLVYESYGYGEYRYSPEQNAVLVSPETKPFSGTGYNSFYQLKGSKFQLKFTISEDQGEIYYSDEAENSRSITETERKKYFKDVVTFEWKMVP